MVENFADWKDPPPPLKKRITCGTTNCKAGYHSFRTDMRLKINRDSEKGFRNGPCSCCGESIVDWKRIDKRNLQDFDYLKSQLKLELFRKNYWEKSFDQTALKRVEKKSFVELKDEAEKILRRSITLPTHEQYRDGIQTKLSGNVIFYAQHATATCCRKCLEAWHAIDSGTKISETDLEYALNLVLLYLEKRIPSLIKNKQIQKRGKM